MIIKKTAAIENKLFELSCELDLNRVIEKNVSNLCKMPLNSLLKKMCDLSEHKADIMFEILTAYRQTIVSPDEREFFADIQDELYLRSGIFDKKFFESNPYYKAIHCEKDMTSGKFKLTTRVLPKYTILSIDEECTSLCMNIAIPCIGLFKDDIPFLCLTEEDKVWMSIMPIEINTMEKAIQEAKGNVLTFGCGLGYFAFMTAEKESVNSVTIVESSDDVISLFTNCILPQFPHKEKINIVKADAFAYAKELSDGVFDYCFIDIWQNGDEVQAYSKMKNICKKFHKMKVSYWIEKELLQSISRYVKLVMINEYYERNIIENYKEQQKNALSSVGIDINELSEEQKQDLFVINSLLDDFIYFTNQLKDVKINTVADIEYYLKPENWL